MTLSEDFLYVGLEKTGSSYILEQLKKYFNKNIVHKDEIRHERMKVCQELYGVKKYNLGSIRNPFELYISHFSYGCLKKGGLYLSVKNYGLNRVYWLLKSNRPGRAFKALLRSIAYMIKWPYYKSINRLYSDPNNKDNFKKWVIFVNSRVRHSSSSFDDDVKFGIVTEKFLSIYCDYDTDTKGRVIRKSIKILPNIWIRNEKIAQDLKFFLNKIDPTINYTYDSKKINKSAHLDYDYYYDDDLRNYIYKMDEFVFNKFY